MTGNEFSLENIKQGLRHPARVFDELILEHSYRLTSTLLNSRRTIGTHIYEQEWDVLVILDTCRVDALQAIADGYEFLGDIDSIHSVGGASGEWVARTFDKHHRAEIAETAYLTANAHARQILDDRTQETDPDKHLNYKALRFMPTLDISDLGYCEYLFQYERWGEEGPLGHVQGMTPPRYVTERAIDIGRNQNHDRMILHYFQPHSPWVANAIKEDRGLKRHEEDWWNYLTETGDVETIWNSYLDDLRYVLDDIEILLKNLDADKVALTADHGEAFGEFGVLGHNIGSLHPMVRKVPWVVTTGVDTETYSPTITSPREKNKLETSKVQKQLKALGYDK